MVWCVILVIGLIQIEVAGLLNNSFFDDVVEYIDDKRCKMQFKEFTRKFMKEDWTLRMIDASSKLQSGVMLGNLNDIGNFDECLQIEHAFLDDEYHEEHLIGKYCYGGFSILLSIQPEEQPLVMENSPRRYPHRFPIKSYAEPEIKRIPLTMGALCIPDACKPSDFKAIIKYLNIGSYVSLNDLNCQTKKEEHLNGYNIFAIVFFSTVSAIMLSSTVYDILATKKEQRPIFAAFSVFTNGQKLLSVKKTTDQFQCLYGLRALSMMWVILGHLTTEIDTNLVINMLEAQEMKKSITFQFINGAQLSVDTFLFLTGFLTSNIFMKNHIKYRKRFNLALFYIHRYLRLTPALLATYVFLIGIYKITNSGPLWSSMADYLVAPCYKWWWSVFLYVQNYFNGDEICLMPAWYLSMDMQIFIFSPIVLWPLLKWRKCTKFALYVLLAVAIAIPAVTTTRLFYYFHYSTHARLAPYVIGIILGIHIFETGNMTWKLHRVLNYSIWITVLTGMGAIVFTGSDVIYDYGISVSTAYFTLRRTLWPVGLSWIVLASIKGHGGIVNWFLSLPVFEFLGKLSYSMYLLHIPVMSIFQQGTRLPLYITYSIIIFQFWGFFMLIAAISSLWVLAFEYPVTVIENIIFGRKMQNKITSGHNNGSQLGENAIV